MKKGIKKHQFEAVSLLTTQSGLLEVTIIPVTDQPDWLLPTSLVMSIETYSDRIWTYLWHDQDIAVYHLVPPQIVPEKIVVVEGNTAVHRIGFQVSGEIRSKKVRISDVKDIELPEEFVPLELDEIVANSHFNENDAAIGEIGIPYVYQSVILDGEIFVVPDIDMIAHQLVDLDS